jgi:Fic family protein
VKIRPHRENIAKFKITSSTCAQERRHYTPPPPLEVPQMMTDFVSWLQKDTQIHPVIVAGIAQFQLVHVHPFVDGNGRTARLLSTLCLYRTGYDFKRLFTISEYYDRDRPSVRR